MTIQRVPRHTNIHKNKIPQQLAATGRGKLAMGCQRKGKRERRGGGGRRPLLRSSSRPQSILFHGDDTDVIHDVMEKDAGSP